MSWIKDKFQSFRRSGKKSPKNEPHLGTGFQKMKAESLRDNGPILSANTIDAEYVKTINPGIVDDALLSPVEHDSDVTHAIIDPVVETAITSSGSIAAEENAGNNPAMRVLTRIRKRKAASSARSRQGETKQTSVKKRSNVDFIALGFTLNNADFWLKLHPNGEGENLNISAAGATSAAELDGVPVFRLTNYDKGLLFNKKLRGKSLRNAMLREKEISDAPASFPAYGLRWFTRKSTVQVADQPVHPLGASLLAYSRKKGWNPEKGILLYTGIRVQNYTVWVYLAIGKNGIGVPQVANINAEADRPAFNMSFSSGLLVPKEYETHSIAPDELFQWLSTGNHKTYPQPGEWFGQNSRVVGKGVMIFGLATCVVGAGVWWVGDDQLRSAKNKVQKVQREIGALRAEKVSFLKAHLPEIAYSFNIPLSKDIAASESLWKPGTQVVMADGMPLGVSSSSNAPAISSPGAMQQAHAPAAIAVMVPITKNLGDGQSSWVSPRILYSVISQNPVDGFDLQSITHNTIGGGYVVIFSRGR